MIDTHLYPTIDPNAVTDIDPLEHMHDPRSGYLYGFIENLDFRLSGDAFCLRTGGDGDNGELLLAYLDAWYAALDEADADERERLMPRAIPLPVEDVCELYYDMTEDELITRDRLVSDMRRYGDPASNAQTWRDARSSDGGAVDRASTWWHWDGNVLTSVADPYAFMEPAFEHFDGAQRERLSRLIDAAKARRESLRP